MPKIGKRCLYFKLQLSFLIIQISKFVCSEPVDQFQQEYILLTPPTYDTDYVDVLAPIGAVVDARAAARLLDALVFVVEWGKTDRKLLREAFRNDPRLSDMCVGVLLNKVDPKKIKLYESHGHASYYGQSYAKYYA